ncbi:MAG: AAA family ATPase [Terriglobales bacterium]
MEPESNLGRNVAITGNASENIIITGDANTVQVYVNRVARFDGRQSSAGSAPKPYQGLAAFTENDADWFYGREELISLLWGRFSDLHKQKGPRFRLLAVLGPSGSGKSSLVRAGLVPEFARQSFGGSQKLRVAIFTPTSSPFEALASSVTRMLTSEVLPLHKIREVVEELKRPSQNGSFDGLSRIARALPDISSSPLILVIDQFEEVFTECLDLEEREKFITTLLTAISDDVPVSIVITMRSDFIRDTQAYPKLNRAIAAQEVTVPVMDEAELRRAISQPAIRAGRPLRPDLVTAFVLETIGRPGALPLLQVALAGVWNAIERGEDGLVALSLVGGVGGALASQAEQIYSRLSTKDQELSKGVFLKLLTISENGLITRKRSDLGKLRNLNIATNPTDIRHLLLAFSAADARILTISADQDGSESVEIAHEALLIHWTRLKDWIEPVKDDIRLYNRFSSAVSHWDHSHRQTGLLWRSPDLELLQIYVCTHSEQLTEPEREFFRQSETAEKDRVRTKRLFFWSSWTVAFLMTVLAVIAGLEWRASNREREAANLALAQGLVSQGDALSAQNRWMDAKILYTDAAHKFTASRSTTLPADLGLLVAYEKAPPELLRIKIPGESIVGLELLASGRDALIASEAESKDHIGSTAHLFRLNILTGDIDKIVEFHDRLEAMALSPDNSHMALMTRHLEPNGTSDSLSLRIWDGRTYKELNVVSEHSTIVLDPSLKFSDDGAFILDTLGQLRRSGDGVLVHQFSGHSAQTTSVAISTPAKMVATGGVDETVKLFNLLTYKDLRTIAPRKGSIGALTFSSDGQSFAFGTSDSSVAIESGKSTRVLSGHKNPITSLDFSRDASELISGSQDRTAILWDTATGSVRSVFTNPDDIVSSVKLTRDGSLALTGSPDGTVSIWKASGNTEVAIGSGHQAGITSVAISAKGLYAASTSLDHTLKLWDTSTGTVLQTVNGLSEYISNVVFVKDDTQLLYSDTGRLMVFDIEANQVRHEFDLDPSFVLGIAPSPDGRYAAVSSLSHGVQLVDLTSGQSLRQLGKLDDEGRYNSDDSIEALTFSNDGKFVIGGDAGGRLRLWSTDNGNELWKISDHARGIASVSISPNGGTIASAGVDKEIHLVRLKDGSKVRSLLGHTGMVNTVKYSADGRSIVSSSDDGTVRIWDSDSGAEIRVFTGHKAIVRGAALSQSGEVLVSGSFDKTVRFMDFRRPSIYRSFPEVGRLTHPTTPEAKKMLGEWYAFRGEWNAALVLLEQARDQGARIDPLVLGRAFWMQGRYREAAVEFEKAETLGKDAESRLHERLCHAAILYQITR